jgi:hypothetical protein
MRDQRPHRKVLRIAAGVVVALALAATAKDLSRGSSRPSFGGSAADGTPTPTAPSQSRDPSAGLLADLIVNNADLGGLQQVAGLPGGNGLSQPTLDLCNGTFPSETQRTARLQVRAVDSAGETTLSTEAVLYASGAGTMAAFSELKDTAAKCPPGPVESPVGLPTVTTKFGPAPDADWPQVPTVERIAFSFDSIDSSGETTRSVAVYLRRGRALLGVYFSHADAPTATVQGKTALGDIVAVFADRLAKLPVSAVSTTA